MAIPAAPFQPRHRAEALLDSMLAQKGVRGALLISRDGFPVLTRSAQITTPDTFAAMQAASLGAAEMAYEGVAGWRGLTLVGDLGAFRFLTRGAGETFILVLQVAADADLNAAMATLASACEKLTALR